MADENTVRSGNLFDFATSELSQDAFVCWLCSRWDDPDDTVRAASQNLLHAMLGSDDPTPVWVPRVARQQWHVDVALLTEHADVRRIVIVEDKTGSVDHDDQLRRYPEQTDDLFPGEPYDGVRVVYRFWFESAPPFRVEVNQIISACSVVGCTGVWFRFPLRRSYRSSSCGSIGVLPTGIGVGGRRGRA